MQIVGEGPTFWAAYRSIDIGQAIRATTYRRRDRGPDVANGVSTIYTGTADSAGSTGSASSTRSPDRVGQDARATPTRTGVPRPTVAGHHARPIRADLTAAADSASVSALTVSIRCLHRRPQLVRHVQGQVDPVGHLQPGVLAGLLDQPEQVVDRAVGDQVVVEHRVQRDEPAGPQQTDRVRRRRRRRPVPGCTPPRPARTRRRPRTPSSATDQSPALDALITFCTSLPSRGPAARAFTDSCRDTRSSSSASSVSSTARTLTSSDSRTRRAAADPRSGSPRSATPAAAGPAGPRPCAPTAPPTRSRGPRPSPPPARRPAAARPAAGQSVRCTDRSPVSPRQITSEVSGSSGATTRQTHLQHGVQGVDRVRRRRPRTAAGTGGCTSWSAPPGTAGPTRRRRRGRRRPAAAVTSSTSSAVLASTYRSSTSAESVRHVPDPVRRRRRTAPGSTRRSTAAAPPAGRSPGCPASVTTRSAPRRIGEDIRNQRIASEPSRSNTSPDVRVVAPRLGHLLPVVAEHDAVRHAGAERRPVEQRGGQHVQRVEPAAGLPVVLDDEVARVVVLEPLAVLERVVHLGVRHRAGLEPAVQHLRHPAHGRAPGRVVRVRPGQLVDVRPVQVVRAGRRSRVPARPASRRRRSAGTPDRRRSRPGSATPRTGSGRSTSPGRPPATCRTGRP